MNTPQTTNSLMRHLRNNCQVNINGSYQKRQLLCYGYYHGYKGYRFFQTSQRQIPYSDFSEVIAVIEYDNNIKAALYPNLMFIETALKNIVCNESIKGLKYGTFDHLYNERMNDNTSDPKLQLKRLQLRNTVYSKLAEQYRHEKDKSNQMVRHFYDRGEDAPIWVIFETLYLSDLANFFSCLNKNIRENILTQIGILDVSVDTNRMLLETIIYTLKVLRNSVAHNNIIFDTRFKDRKISTILKRWIEKEVNIKNITLYSLIDYIIIICCILKKIDFDNERATQLLKIYKQENDILRSKVSQQVYDKILQNQVTSKISELENYLNL